MGPFADTVMLREQCPHGLVMGTGIVCAAGAGSCCPGSLRAQQVTVATLVSSGPSQAHKMLCQRLNLGVFGVQLSHRGEKRFQNPRGCDFPLSRGSASTPLCLQKHLGPGMPCSGTCPAHPFGSWNTDMRLVFVPCQAKWDPDQSTALPSYFQLFSASQGAASTEDQSDEEQPCLPGSGGRGRVAEPPHPSAEQVPSVSELLP